MGMPLWFRIGSGLLTGGLSEGAWALGKGAGYGSADDQWDSFNAGIKSKVKELLGQGSEFDNKNFDAQQEWAEKEYNRDDLWRSEDLAREQQHREEDLSTQERWRQEDYERSSIGHRMQQARDAGLHPMAALGMTGGGGGGGTLPSSHGYTGSGGRVPSPVSGGGGTSLGEISGIIGQMSQLKNDRANRMLLNAEARRVNADANRMEYDNSEEQRKARARLLEQQLKLNSAQALQAERAYAQLELEHKRWIKETAGIGSFEEWVRRNNTFAGIAANLINLPRAAIQGLFDMFEKKKNK